LVQSVEYRIDDARRFFEARRWLFPSRPDLELFRDRLAARLAWEKKRVDPEIVPDDEPPEIEDVIARIRAGLPAAGLLERFPDGYFAAQVAGPDGARTEALVIRVRLAGNPNDFSRVEALDRSVRAAVASVRAEREWTRVAVDYGGHVASTKFEHDGLAEDLVVASAFVLLAVALAIAIYYRTAKAIVAVGAPLMVGALVTFAIAELVIGHLNANTAFLGSIVVGNGINVGLILFARYAEERRAGAAPTSAMTTAVAGTWLATLTAALAAGISYASLAFTNFRGFTQFGIIGGVGMAACWLASYAFTPALALAWERRATLVGPEPPRGPRVMGSLARRVERSPRAVLAAAGALAIASVVFAVRLARDPLEYDFGNLRDSRALEGGGPAFWEDAVFGGHLDPCVVLAAGADEARAVAAAFEARQREAKNSSIGSVVSVATFVPEDQAAKLPVIESIRFLATPEALSLAPAEARPRLAALVPLAGLRPFGVVDLPPLVRRRLTERDGTLGTTVLVYPAPWVNVWNGKDALRVEADLRAATLPRPDIPMASSLLVFADVLHAIARDGPRATLLSLVGVALLVLASFGTGSAGGLSHAGLVLGALASGVLAFLGLAGALGLKLNMLSFIALPITFGIGADYATNIVQRHRLGSGWADALRTTGGAVVLCSLTTVIGYSSLLVAHNRALRSFGLLADLGEFACLAAALAVLPAFALWRERRT
jgi:hypothetical protein